MKNLILELALVGTLVSSSAFAHPVIEMCQENDIECPRFHTRGECQQFIALYRRDVRAQNADAQLICVEDGDGEHYRVTVS